MILFYLQLFGLLQISCNPDRILKLYAPSIVGLKFHYRFSTIHSERNLMRISLNIVRIFKSHSLSATNVGNEFWWENDKVYIVCHILSSLL